MENIKELNNQFEILFKNINSMIRLIEKQKLYISEDEVSPLGKILSQIKITNINEEMLKIKNLEEKEKVISFLTYEMMFLNSKYPRSEHEINLNQNKWLRVVSIVLKSMESYLNIPFLEFVREIVKIGSIIVE
jgi:hypothetical protein